jgi:hypothetical protein
MGSYLQWSWYKATGRRNTISGEARDGTEAGTSFKGDRDLIP